MTYHFLLMAIASDSIDKVGDEPPEAVHQSEKDGCNGGRHNDDRGEAGDLLFRGPGDFRELLSDLFGELAGAGAAPVVEGGDASHQAGEKHEDFVSRFADFGSEN